MVSKYLMAVPSSGSEPLLTVMDRALTGRAQRALFALADDLVHLWCARLDPPAATVAKLERWLCGAERARAERFRVFRDWRRFVVGRGFLRQLIGCYLDCEPSAIQFAYGPCGKPALARQPRLGSLSFNLSHSGSLAVFAFARGRELGVDVEQLDPEFQVYQVADHFFTAGEVAGIMARPPDQQHVRFFELWTRKEALIKARGEGLSMALRELDASIFDDPRGGPLARSLADSSVCWSVRQFVPAPGYLAALAASGCICRVACRQVRWTESRSSGFAASPNLSSSVM